MVLSKKRNFCFIHIPKTAGISIRTALLSSLPIYDKLYYKLCARYINKTNHVSVKELQESVNNKEWWARYMFKDLEAFDRSYKFSFVRNPWDRVVSLFFYYQKYVKKYNGRTVDTIRENLKSIKNINDFVDQVYQERDWLMKLHGPKPQVEFLKNKDGKLSIDFIGKLENINDDFNHICECLGIESNLPHKNKTNHKNYKDYLSEESINKVADYYKEDIEKFSYKL